MAVLKSEKIKGVDLPYKRVHNWSGDKQNVEVSISHQAFKDAGVLSINSVDLTLDERTLISDKVTALIYKELKLLGYLDGSDV